MPDFYELFRSGTLEMPVDPLAAAPEAIAWGDIAVNRVLILVSAALFVVGMKDVFKLMPHLLYSIDRARGTASLDYNSGIARLRNWTALFCLIPFCLLADRFGAVHPRFMEAVPAQWSVAAHAGLLLSFLAVRRILAILLTPRRMDMRTSQAARHCIYDFFIVLTMVLVAVCGGMAIAGLPDGAVRMAMYVLTGLAYAIAMVRTLQILASYRGGFRSFLYLCGLELFPAAAFVSCMVLL